MKPNEMETARWRAGFAGLASLSGGGSDCPTAESLWASARGELAPRENEAVVLHLGECTTCAAAWRLARDLAPPAETAAHASRVRTGPWGWPGLLAAAALVLGSSVLLLLRAPQPSGQEAVHRGAEAPALRSLVPMEAGLPRGGFVLRWTAGPPGTVYDVVVTSATLTPLARASRLEQPSLQLTEHSLAPLASGARVLWRVTARFPDGRAFASPTFVVRVQ